MSLLPASDLIIDVGRAADPSRKAEALHRLERLSFSAGDGETIPDFPKLPLDYKAMHPSFHISKATNSIPLHTLPRRMDNGSVAFKKFEAFILQTWLEILLPKVNGGAFGNDQAGGLWRSLMAEQLGDQLAKSDSLGITRLIEHSAQPTDDAPDPNRSFLGVKSNVS